MVDLAKKHFTIVFGPSQSGKDTLIYNFDRSNKNNTFDSKPILEFGNGFNSQTKEFRVIEYQNEDIIPGKKSYILNTIGMGDTQGDYEDTDIALELLDWCLREGSKLNGGVDAILFVQALNNPFLVEKCIQYVKLGLGDDVLKSSILVATKGNMIADEDEFDMKMDGLREIQIKYRIPELVDFRGKYFIRKKGAKEMIDKTAAKSDEQIYINIAELGMKIQKLPHFSFDPLLKDLQKKYFEEVKKKATQKKEIKTEKKSYRKKWFTLWLVKHEFIETVTTFEEFLTKSDDQILEEAMIETIKQKKGELKEKLSPKK